jgi:DNA-binding YbaB/EbfC family protein
MLPKGNMGNLIKQARRMQETLEKVQQELEHIHVEGSAGGGMVTVVANGKQEIISVKIDPEIISEDTEMIEDLIVAAVNQALSRSQEESQRKISEATGGIIPPGMKIPGL